MPDATMSPETGDRDSFDVETGARLRQLRKGKGWSQEDLVEYSGVSLTVVKKLERGGNARPETLHRLATALGVRTMTFVPAGYPGPSLGGRDDSVFAAIRAAIAPPIGINGKPLYGAYGTADHDELSLPRLATSVDALGAAYHGMKFDQLSTFAPALVHSANHHVNNMDGADHDEARRLRADILNITARYLIQVREHDLGMKAIGDSLHDALAIGDQPLAGSAVSVQAWAMMRQGRFDQVELLCAQAADAIEPRMSTAKLPELDAWGWLLLRASAAAARNNRPEAAQEYADLAIVAGNRLGQERGRPAGRSFGPLSAALILPENAMVAGRPDKAVELFRKLPTGTGQTNASTWDRARLDEARAHLQLGDPRRATKILASLRRNVPGWLSHQQHGHDVVRELLEAAPRLTDEHRALADLYAIG